jgi:hypothetical protein
MITRAGPAGIEYRWAEICLVRPSCARSPSGIGNRGDQTQSSASFTKRPWWHQRRPLTWSLRRSIMVRVIALTHFWSMMILIYKPGNGYGTASSSLSAINDACSSFSAWLHSWTGPWLRTRSSAVSVGSVPAVGSESRRAESRG